MTGVLSVSKSKSAGDDSIEAVLAVDIGTDNGEGKPQVKLRPEFKERLRRVAQHYKIDMGILIEKYMIRFITREDRKISQELLERDDEAE